MKIDIVLARLAAQTLRTSYKLYWQASCCQPLMKSDIPLIVLVALTTTVVSLICRNLQMRDSISQLHLEVDNKQATIERLLDQHDELMRQMRGLGPRLAVE